VRVIAAALNIEDLHVARGWCAFHNHLRWNMFSYIVFLWDRGFGTPDNIIRENNLVHIPKDYKRFPIVLGREFCGEVIDSASDLMYNYPRGSKVIGYLKPHESGALTECLNIHVSQVAPLPTNLSPIEG